MPAQKRLFTKLKLWRFGLTSLLILFYLVTPTAVAADFLKITAPAEITKEESFEVNLEISAQAGTTYSVKARLGSEPNQLTKAQTFSEGKNVWLSDSVSWSSFPKFTTDNNGMWIGTIKVRTSDKVTLGQNYLVIRIRNENGSTVDSAIYTLTVKEPEIKEVESEEKTIEEPGKPRLNEFAAQPQSGGEWIEIKNYGKGPADISGWFVDDEPGKSTPMEIPQGTIIQPNKFFVVNFKSPKLNDLTDMVRLLDPKGKEVESFHYEKTVKGQSWAKDAKEKWFLTENITPNKENPNQEVPNQETKATTLTEKVEDSQETEQLQQTVNQPTPVLGESLQNEDTATVSASFKEKAGRNMFTPLVFLGILLLIFGILLFLKKRFLQQTQIS